MIGIGGTLAALFAILLSAMDVERLTEQFILMKREKKFINITLRGWWLPKSRILEWNPVRSDLIFLGILAISFALTLPLRIGLFNPLVSPSNAVIPLWGDFIWTGITITCASTNLHDLAKRLRKGA
jgi:hypothetical protein